MSRREFLCWAGALSLSGCARPRLVAEAAATAAAPPAAGNVRAVAFDLFTLFDPRGVDRRIAAVVGENPGFATTWKMKLFEYSWLRAASGQYRDFENLASDALSYSARAHDVVLSDQARAELAGAFTELEPWPDSAAVLEQLRARGLKLAPLANFSPRMIERLLGRAKLLDHFDALISTDRAQSYKPDPRAYALAETTFGLPKKQIAFSAFGGWDAAGADWFGFPTFWVNRLSRPSEELGAEVATGPDLTALARWIT
ncbi:MAG TPA: haloacid dehalogenase type II [Polyangiaceae bacterium]|nr:haloacid dehalogenase type II [Polyangiaceae bacterium]